MNTPFTLTLLVQMWKFRLRVKEKILIEQKAIL